MILYGPFGFVWLGIAYDQPVRHYQGFLKLRFSTYHVAFFLNECQRHVACRRRKAWGFGFFFFIFILILTRDYALRLAGYMEGLLSDILLTLLFAFSYGLLRSLECWILHGAVLYDFSFVLEPFCYTGWHR
jgi:hypothetical protein